jgi:hypothetical protein
VAVNSSIKVNVFNRGEHYETPCILYKCHSVVQRGGSDALSGNGTVVGWTLHNITNGSGLRFD